jgi:hypothetical protein
MMERRYGELPALAPAPRFWSTRTRMRPGFDNGVLKVSLPKRPEAIVDSARSQLKKARGKVRQGLPEVA